MSGMQPSTRVLQVPARARHGDSDRWGTVGIHQAMAISRHQHFHEAHPLFPITLPFVELVRPDARHIAGQFELGAAVFARKCFRSLQQCGADAAAALRIVDHQHGQQRPALRYVQRRHHVHHGHAGDGVAFLRDQHPHRVAGRHRGQPPGQLSGVVRVAELAEQGGDALEVAGSGFTNRHALV